MWSHDPFQSDDAERLLAAILSASEDAIVGADVSGTIVAWNDGAQRMYGYSAEEMIGQPVAALVTADRRGSVESMNPAAERLFGYRGDEVIGRNVSMLMPAPYAAEHDHYVKRYIDTREARIIGAHVARRSPHHAF